MKIECKFVQLRRACAKKSKMEIDPMDDRELYNKYDRNATTNSQLVSTTISSIVVQGGPLQLVIALLRVRIQ